MLLKDQDRSRWDPALIAEGQTLVLGCMRRRRLGPFQLQAAIQALHCAARGSMLERLGRTDEAAKAYDHAARLGRTDAEVSFLTRHLTRLTVDSPGGSAD